MTYGKFINILFFLAFALLQASLEIGMARNQESELTEENLKSCSECNGNTELLITQAKISSISLKAEMLKIDTESESLLVKFNDETSLAGENSMRDLTNGQEIKIRYRDEGGSLIAEDIEVKKPQSSSGLAASITVEELTQLMEHGSQSETFTLVDSRIESQYNEGHIPGAISIYDGKIEKQPDLLPEDKNGLLIFYCGGTA